MPSRAITGSGFLAIWSDVTPEQETDYLHWLTREHTIERLSIDGFLAVRVYKSSLTNVCRYFIHYELRSPDVLGSSAYLARLNAPTPWSQRIMPILGNFVRGGGRVVAKAGRGRGCTLAALKLDGLTSLASDALMEDIAKGDRIVAAALLETDREQTSIQTREKRMRERDGSFAGLLLIEGLDEYAVSSAVGRLNLQPFETTYAQVFNL